MISGGDGDRTSSSSPPVEITPIKFDAITAINCAAVSNEAIKLFEWFSCNFPLCEWLKCYFGLVFFFPVFLWSTLIWLVCEMCYTNTTDLTFTKKWKVARSQFPFRRVDLAFSLVANGRAVASETFRNESPHLGRKCLLWGSTLKFTGEDKVWFRSYF